MCLTVPLDDVQLINMPQTINISWRLDIIDDLKTDLKFTYKPDPVIEAIHPNITVVR